ncbi:MAG: hypothetical protein U0822_27285 [Anaerolineae bacterium]
MTYTSIAAYLPIPMPIRSYEEPFREYLYDMLDELAQLSGKLVFAPLQEIGVTEVEVAFLENLTVAERTELEQWFDGETLQYSEMLRIVVRAPIPERQPNGTEVSYTIGGQKVTGSPELFRTHLVHVFNKIVYDIFISANIARPGSIEYGKGVIVQDGQQRMHTDSMSVSPLRDAVRYSGVMGWPGITHVAVNDVWAWLMRQEGFVTGFGGGSVSRALNAFSHLFDPFSDYQPIRLFWALVGIEALYTKGQGGLMEQVKEKSQVLLGSQQKHKKLISRMYDFRSRFVHGDLDFPGIYELWDADDRSMKYFDELVKATELAEAILVATFQELIRRNWIELHFFYEVRES